MAPGTRSDFTFIWAIENATEIHFHNIIVSPEFTVKSIEKSKWRLRLNIHQTTAVNLSLLKTEEDDEPREIKIEYELSFLGTDGLPLIVRADTFRFFRNKIVSMYILANGADIFTRRRAEFLPKNILTVRCRMWMKGVKVLQPEVCFARRRYKMERHCLVWPMKDFSSLTSGHKTTRLLKPTSEGAPELTVSFDFRECYGEACICCDVNCERVVSRGVLSGVVALLDVDGKIVNSKEISIMFFEGSSNRFYSRFFEVQELLSDKSNLLPNDVLSLRCEFEISYGPVWSGIESYEPTESTVVAVQAIRAYVNERHVLASEVSVTGNCPFKENVHKFYEDGTFSDVRLQADSEIFHVHKIVLSSRSPVFEAMFTSDMREKVCKVIDVPDVDPGTLRLLLSYIYRNEVPNLQWDKAADLFRAADKYALLELKKQCSAILKSNMSRSNVCYVLTLADMHHEEDIRKIVLDFISKNLDILSSDEWKTFKNENSDLAMKTMETLLLKTLTKEYEA